MVGGFNSNFHFEDPPLVYPLARQDSLWAECSGGSSSAMLPFGIGGMYGSGDKFPSADFSPHGMLPLFPPDGASSLYSPPSSTQGSVWSPVQTDFASDITVAGTSGSRVPSPLRNMATISVGTEDESVGLKNRCGVALAGKEDLDPHSRASHPHICLWGVNGPCDSAGFATKEELNWHVKREHLLLCPDSGCTEGPFENRDMLDCHLKCTHDSATTGKTVVFQPANLLGATPVLSGASTPGVQVQPSATNSKAPEDKTLKMEMSIGISKKRCRDQLRKVLEKRIKRANGESFSH